jgi:centromeric protein E
MSDLNSRIKQLTKLILTSNSVEERQGDDSRPTSPTKLDFDLSPYQVSPAVNRKAAVLSSSQLQQELLAARRQLDTQTTQILSLEAALAARPVLPADAQPSEKDRLLEEQRLTIEDLRRAISGFEANLGEPLRKVKEDVEEEFRGKIAQLDSAKNEADAWAEELVKQLEREKQVSDMPQLYFTSL